MITDDFFLRIGQDDTVYAEHRPPPIKLLDRPPSSPSRFDLKTRLYRSQSQYQSRPSVESIPDAVESPTTLFEIVHRPPSRNHVRLSRQNTDLLGAFRSSFFREDDKANEQLNKQRLVRPQTVPTAPTIYEVKRGSKIYKVVVGYVSPFTSPLQRKELHLKTDGEVDVVLQEIKKQQEKQRASKPQVWLGVPSPQST